MNFSNRNVVAVLAGVATLILVVVACYLGRAAYQWEQCGSDTPIKYALTTGSPSDFECMGAALGKQWEKAVSEASSSPTPTHSPIKFMTDEEMDEYVDSLIYGPGGKPE